jgi:hypothetical protein
VGACARSGCVCECTFEGRKQTLGGFVLHSTNVLSAEVHAMCASSL